MERGGGQPECDASDFIRPLQRATRVPEGYRLRGEPGCRVVFDQGRAGGIPDHSR